MFQRHPEDCGLPQEVGGWWLVVQVKFHTAFLPPDRSYVNPDIRLCGGGGGGGGDNSMNW